jgi:midasin
MCTAPLIPSHMRGRLLLLPSAAAAAAAAVTQIWVPAITDEAELLAILESRLAASAARTTISRHLLQFWHLFVSQAPTAARGGLSVRDLLAWVGFVNATAQQLGPLQAYAHGAYLTLLDGLGLGLGIPAALLAPLRQKCRRLLEQQLAGNVTAGGVSNSVSNSAEGQQLQLVTVGEAAAVVGQAAGELQLQPNTPVDVTTDDGRWGIPPFFVARGPADDESAAAGSSSSSSSSSGPRFNWQAPTTCRNAFRLLRAMQVGCAARWGKARATVLALQDGCCACVVVLRTDELF